MVSATETSVDSRVAEKPLFRVGEAVYTWNDVVARARASGQWEALEDEVRAGLAALADLGARSEAPTEDDVEAAGRTFRYAKNLLAADELDAWLGTRGLTTHAWEAYLRRGLALEEVPEPAGTGDVAAGEVAAGVWPEGMCSGYLEELAKELATLVAIAPDAPAEERMAAYDAFCAAAATDQAIAREVESNRLEWVRIHYHAVAFPDEDSAAEAAMCVRADGDPLEQLAARIGVDVEERLDWMEEVDPELGARFLAAEPGVLVGPALVGDGFVLAQVHAKTPPTADDEDVRTRAADAVVDRALAREFNERVVWLEPL
jgi:hypothetical protein